MLMQMPTPTSCDESSGDASSMYVSARICDTFEACNEIAPILVSVLSDPTVLPSVEDSVGAVALAEGVQDEARILQTISGIGASVSQACGGARRRLLAAGGSELRSTLTTSLGTVLGQAQLDEDLLEGVTHSLNASVSVGEAGGAGGRNETRGIVTALLSGAEGLANTNDNVLNGLSGVIGASLFEVLDAADGTANESSTVVGQLQLMAAV